MTAPRARARLNVEALIAAMLERVPLPEVARRIESIACDGSHMLRASIDTTAWHHTGLRLLISDLAERVLSPPKADLEEPWRPSGVAGDAAAPVRVGWEIGYRGSVGGRTELLEVLPDIGVAELLAVNDKLAAIARGAGASASLTSADLAVIAFALGEAARVRAEGHEKVEVAAP